MISLCALRPCYRGASCWVCGSLAGALSGRRVKPSSARGEPSTKTQPSPYILTSLPLCPPPLPPRLQVPPPIHPSLCIYLHPSLFTSPSPYMFTPLSPPSFYLSSYSNRCVPRSVYSLVPFRVPPYTSLVFLPSSLPQHILQRSPYSCFLVFHLSAILTF